MNSSAKQLITETPGDDGSVPPDQRQERPMRRPMRRQEPGMAPGDERDFDGRPGGAPRGMFSPQEVSILKDLTMLMLMATGGSSTDKPLVDALISGKDPSKNDLQHLLDEVGRLPNLDERQKGLLTKIAQQMGY